MSGMSVTTEEAYREACLALGESIVAQRFVTREAARLGAELEELRQQREATNPAAHPSEVSP